MRKYENIKVSKETLTELKCDRCGIVVPCDDLYEFQEFMSYWYSAGYGNKQFNDGDELEIDLCQHCVRVVLGPYMRVVKTMFGDLEAWNALADKVGSGE